MTATNFAKAEDIAAVWRALRPGEEAIVDGLLAEASNKLRARGLAVHQNVDTLVAADPLKAEFAKTAVVNAVRRRLSNFNGLLTEAIDDWSGRRDSSVSTGEIYIADIDLVGLLPAVRKRRRVISSFHVRAGM